MFKKLNLLSLLVVSLLVLFTVSCEGPAGPAGADGLAGVDGVDLNQTCKVCHNSSSIIVGRVNQYNQSGHANNGTSFYGNREGSCSECHTSEGFIAFLETGEYAAEPWEYVSQQNCRTCHTIHTAYDSTDWALRVTEPVARLEDPTHTMMNFGKGNLCVSCHLSRAADLPAVASVDSFTVSSSRFGPHHGPQGDVLDGSAGYQLAGSKSYGTGQHPHSLTADGCVGCHMADGGNYDVGGHTWKMTTDYHATGGHLNTTPCLVCHTTETAATVETKMEDTKAAIDLIMTALGDSLVSQGLLTSTGSAKSGKYPVEKAGALYNYRMFAIEDPGYFIHNPSLAKALLQNSLEAVQ
ncbi:MAG: hypothetical protein K9N35_05870 [Candidatus Marinimicrobia bacterium]|nr:hypothetical protein [Candidatus Neomarinimicrobiota bacterium]